MTYYNGDDFNAFGNQSITVEVSFEQEEEPTVSKAIAVFNDGVICKEFVTPQFPLEIPVTEEDSKKLTTYSTLKLVVFDADGKRKQCDGVLQFRVEKGVICEG